jgi:arylsulfatase/arylsulfatase A
MIRDSRWKLLHASGFGRERLDGDPEFELYDIRDDPGETRNLIHEEPQVLARLRTAYDEWFDDVSSTRPDNYAPPRIHIGTPHENPTVLTRQDWRGGTWAPDAVGYWELYVAERGSYNVRLEFDPKPAAGSAELKISGLTKQTAIATGDTSCEYAALQLGAGDTQLHAVLSHDGKQRGVYQVVVTKR